MDLVTIMDYSPSVWHYLLSALLFVGGTTAGYWSFPLLIALYALGVASAAFIFVMGVWDRTTADKYGMASVMDKLPGLTTEQQAVLIGRYPELRLMLGESTLEPEWMVGDCGVPLRFFIEFMGMKGCNEYHTGSKRDITWGRHQTRDEVRDMFDRLTKYLMTCPGHYLAAAPIGNETYQWRSGAYLQLWNSYVLPYADLVGMRAAPIVVAPERTGLYRAEV